MLADDMCFTVGLAKDELVENRGPFVPSEGFDLLVVEGVLG